MGGMGRSYYLSAGCEEKSLARICIRRASSQFPICFVKGDSALDVPVCVENANLARPEARSGFGVTVVVGKPYDSSRHPAASVLLDEIIGRSDCTGLDGSGLGARVHLGGPRQCLRVDILPDVRQFAISNGNGEDPMVLKRLIRGFDSPRSEADDQNPVSLRYELGGLWERSFHRFVNLLK
jgi:hypothetical protein